MSSSGNGWPDVYKVVMSGQVRAAVKQLHAQAANKGTGHLFVAALRQIIERLRRQPEEFGEPKYRLPALHLLVYQAVILPLSVYYAVHEEQPFVLIKDFRVLS